MRGRAIGRRRRAAAQRLPGAAQPARPVISAVVVHRHYPPASVFVRSISLRIGPVTVDVTRDFTGDTCLRTNLVTKMILDHCAPGSVAEIATDNVASVETIPFMLPGHRCVHLATVRTEAGWNIYVRKENTRK